MNTLNYRRNKMSTTTIIEIKEDLHRKIKMYAAASGLKMYKIAEMALTDFIKNHPVEENENSKY